MSTIADGRFAHLDPACRQLVHFFQQLRRVDDNAVADNGGHFGFRTPSEEGKLKVRLPQTTVWPALLPPL